MTNQEKTEILMLRVIVGILFLSVVFFSFIIHDKSVENKALIKHHNSSINELNAKLESKDAEIKEAQEWIGIVFEEGADITNKYNELKNKCKKVKR